MDAFAITIVAPEAQEDALETDLAEAGAAGFTSWKTRGFGTHGARPSQWTNANVRIDVLVDGPTRERVLAMLESRHPRSHGVFAWIAPVEVVR